MDLPAYRSVADQLRQEIESGDWKSGDRLPPEHSLTKKYGVSRNTVRQALTLLEDSNLVTRRQGSGTFVLDRGVSHVLGDLRSFTDILISLGKAPGITGISIKVDEAPPTDAQEFLPGKHVWLVQRIRTGDGLPFCFMQSWLPDAIGAAIDEDDLLEQQSLYASFATLDVKPSEATEIIRAESASDLDAQSLEIKPGDPVLSIYRWTSDAAGRPIEFVRSTSPGDRYEYVVKLRQ